MSYTCMTREGTYQESVRATDDTQTEPRLALLYLDDYLTARDDGTRSGIFLLLYFAGRDGRGRGRVRVWQSVPSY